jgi:23S rRNA U2552 (ribose-2'-O)-methylase RlmE/FtsJ
MVKKYSFEFSGDYTPGNEPFDDIKTTHLLQYNESLHRYLKAFKEQITFFYQNKKWDRYKKYVNDYELIFTTCHGLPSLSENMPTSRSFFKMWEILGDFAQHFNMNSPERKRCAFLAEGPGGFLEAFGTRRKQLAPSTKDDLFGITLKSGDRNIPYWKIPPHMFDDHSIKLLNGQDGTGNICLLPNIQSTINDIGVGTCDLVTADGGFDFSSDFNNQEAMSIKLIISEIFIALKTQKPNGIFLLKIYDIYNTITFQILYILKLLYKKIHLIKPLTSRPANSEKYVLAMGYMPDCKELPKVLRELEIATRAQSFDEINLFLHVPVEFVSDVVYYNQFYIQKQILHIFKTIVFITACQNPSGMTPESAILQSNLKEQLRKSIKWFAKYQLPISLSALHQYKFLYTKNNHDEEVELSTAHSMLEAV